MAKSYNDIYTAVYIKGNKMDFTNSMIRGNGIPLDITDVYNSFEAAQNYVNSNPVAYEGQVIAVTENNDTTVYVIAARLAEDGVTVEHYLKEVGKTPEVDNVTIKIIDGKLTAIVPEYEDTDTQYTLSVLADGKISFVSDATGAEATEISFVGAQGIEVTSDAETGIITITGPDLSGFATKEEVYNVSEINDMIEELEEAINTKADSSEVTGRFDELEDKVSQKVDRVDVYTTTETDKKIGEAVAAADHLKRKIVEAPGEGETIENVIDKTKDDADQYIYMVPTGLQESDNKYREYIVIIDETTGNRYIEQVGNWEVDLSGYLTIASAEETYAKKNDVASTYATKAEVTKTLEDYATKSEVTTTLESYTTKTEVANTLEGYVTDQELSTTLSGYATKTEIPTDYVSTSKFEEEIAKYETAETAEGKYAGKDNTYTKEEVDDLLDDKVDVTAATSDNGIRFINQTEINKLSKLNLEGDDITISGSVNASQVKELYATVANIVKGSVSDLDPDTEGEQLGLGIEEGAQVNFINSVNTDNFKVENKKLDLVAVPAKLLTDLGEEFVVDSTDNKLKLVQVEAKKLTGLEDWIEENRDAVAGLYPTTAATLLNNLDTAINDEATGLIAKLTAVDSRLITVEASVSDHTDRLGALEYAMAWHDMEETETI